MIELLRLLALVSALFFVSHIAASSIAGLRFAERLVAAALVAAGILVVCGLVLGALVPALTGRGLLAYPFLLGAVLAVGALVWVVAIRKGSSGRESAAKTTSDRSGTRPSPGDRVDAPDADRRPAGDPRGPGAVARLASPFLDLARAVSAVVRARPRGVAGTIASLVVAAALVYGFALGLLIPPSTGDGLMYHLMIATSWIPAKRIVVPELGPYLHCDLWAWFPGNAYLIQMPTLLSFGSDSGIFLVSWISAIVAGLSAWAIARRLGAGDEPSAWAGLLWCSIPIVLNQSRTELVDLPLAAAVSASILFLLVARDTGAIAPLVLAGAGGGLALGLKPSGPVYWGTILVAGGALLLPRVDDGGASSRRAGVGVEPQGASAASAASQLRARSDSGFVPRIISRSTAGGGVRRAATFAAILLACALLLSGYWLVRNALERGHPLFPSNVVATRERHYTGRIVQNLAAALTDGSVYGSVHNYESGVGPAYAALILPAILVLALRRWRSSDRGVAALLLLVPALHLFWFFELPASVGTIFRYVLPILPLGLASFATVLSTAAGRTRGVLTTAAATCVAAATLGALPGIGAFTDTGRIPELLRERGTMPLDRFSLAADLFIHDYREVWRWVDGHLSGRRIATLHNLFPYPLKGRTLSNEIVVVPTTTETEWLSEIDRRGVEDLAVSRVIEPLDVIAGEGGGTLLRLVLRPPFDPEQAQRRLVLREPLSGVERVRFRYEYVGEARFRAVAGLNEFRSRLILPRETEGGPAPSTGAADEHEPTGASAGVATIECEGGILKEVDFAFLRDGGVFGGPDPQLRITEFEVRFVAPSTPQEIPPMKPDRLDGPIEWYWIRDHPERFRLLTSGEDHFGHWTNTGRFEIYEVARAR